MSPVWQLCVQGHDALVDLGAHALVAHGAVDAVGKVQGRGVLGQVDGVALWREDEDLVVGEELLLQGLHELLGVVDLAVDVHELVDEVERLVKLRGLAAVLYL